MLDLKQLIMAARKERNTAKVNILSFIAGECERTQSEGEKVYNVIRKTIEANKDLLKLRFDLDLVEQNKILDELLPKYLTVDELGQKISLQSDEIHHNLENSKSKGQKIGIVIKYCKQKGWNVLPETVEEYVDKRGR